MAEYESDVPLKSPWWVADDLEWAHGGPILVRGMRVGEDIPLTKLVNVAGMRLFSHDDPKKDRVKWIGRTPAGRLASNAWTVPLSTENHVGARLSDHGRSGRTRRTTGGTWNT